MRCRFFVALLFVSCLVALVIHVRRWQAYRASLGGQKSVADRLKEFEKPVHKRLAPDFERAGVPYPPAQLVLVGLKTEKTLEIYASGKNSALRRIRSYPILGASGHAGPKLREGDLQVPEGLYLIESLNPNSSFHLALRVNYPNDFDREQAGTEGRTNLGGDIMIHGNACSIGCLAMGDVAAEDLFILAALTGIGNIRVILSPVDFRQQPGFSPSKGTPEWTGRLYEEIRRELSMLPRD